MNLVLLGMAGTGKSASGNTILGKKQFISKPSSTPVTIECQTAQTEVSGVHVNVIDTPDIFDDDIAPSVRAKHVKRCKQLCETDPCVYVLVMHVSRFTDGERNIMEKLEKAFGSVVREQTIILFTRGDDLQQAGIGLKDFLHSCQPGLKKMVENCGNRCVLFENHKSSSDQVKMLMEKVIRMIQDQKK